MIASALESRASATAPALAPAFESLAALEGHPEALESLVAGFPQVGRPLRGFSRC